MKGLFTLLLAGISMISNAQEFQSYFVEHNGMRHHVRCAGDGPAMLIINGGPGMNSNGFEGLAAQFTATHTVYLYDQRGTGLSPIPENGLPTVTIPNMVADIEAIRTHFNVDSWIVYGHSFGGMMAYAYAAEHPDRITAMIQSSSGGMDLSLQDNIMIDERLTDIQRDSLRWYDARRDTGDAIYELKYREFLACAYLYDDSFRQQIARRLGQARMHINAQVWRDLAAKGYDVTEKMRSFDKPVLLIQGDTDVLNSSIAERSAEVLPNAQLVFVPRSAHYGWIENPDGYLGTVKEFLAGL